MIVFMTLAYVVVLFALVKFKVIKLNLFWKMSPALWMLLLFVVLFIPLQWGAPSGKVNVYNNVIEIVPNVSGEVVEVPVEGLVDVKKDDLLFKIDPEPFQIALKNAQVALADARQKENGDHQCATCYCGIVPLPF